MSGYSLIRNTNRLMLITSSSGNYTEYAQAEMFYKGGGAWVQLRMKENLSIETAQAIARLSTPDPSRIFCMNDSLDIAIQSHARAIHLGKLDMPVAEAWRITRSNPDNKLLHIGATANTLDDILHADRQNATYIGLGPYRFTDTKKNLSPILGLEGYRRIIGECRSRGCRIPIVAVGGIRLEDVAPLLEAGADGIAVSGAIVGAPDPVETTRTFLSEIRKYCGDNY